MSGNHGASSLILEQASVMVGCHKSPNPDVGSVSIPATPDEE
jgi:hypothetical protein